MKPFGTEFCDHFAIARYSGGAWSAASIEPLKPLQLHPAAHVLHYASTCFEGFKAYRWADGTTRLVSRWRPPILTATVLMTWQLVFRESLSVSPRRPAP